MSEYPDFFGPALYDLNFTYAVQSALILADSIRGILKPDSRILDLGTGTGNLALEMAPLAADGAVTGIDLEEGALALARHKAAQGKVQNVSFRKGDACALDFPATSFDAVVANQLFGDQAKIVAEAVRVLKSGGILAMARPHSPRSRSYAWENETLQELAKHYGRSLQEKDLMRKKWSDAASIQPLFDESRLRTVTMEEVDLPRGDAWAAYLLNRMDWDAPFRWTGKRLAEIIGADPADRDALTVAFYEYFRIGRRLLDVKYGGTLTTSVLIAVGRKD